MQNTLLPSGKIMLFVQFRVISKEIKDIKFFYLFCPY